MAAALLVSATSLGRTLGMAAKNAGLPLDRFCTAGIAVEVTYRSKCRPFGQATLAFLRAGVMRRTGRSPDGVYPCHR